MAKRRYPCERDKNVSDPWVFGAVSDYIFQAGVGTFLSLQTIAVNPTIPSLTKTPILNIPPLPIRPSLDFV